ncbi:MAG: aldo/keto reductase [Deltaproteobacteria bacterium]|nr:aldo/keto reductase [Deltaproteobacteria bacterium]
MERREFIKRFTGLGLAVAVSRVPGLTPYAWGAQMAGSIPYRQLGSTGVKVSLAGLGGAHLGGQPDEQESIRIIRAAIDNGINFLDNSWDYHGGQSEIRMGKALRDGYRQKVFLMTKIDGRTKEAAARQIDECLKRLQTDTIDLMQFHEIIRMSDPDRIFGPNGAMEAATAAQQAGKIRYLGFTGHKSPDIHLKMLQTCLAHDFTPATVQMPLNVMDAHYHSFEKKVLPELVKHGIAPLAMKSMGSPYILQSKTVTPVECLHYSMNLPVAVVITGCDSIPILEQALNAARTFRPLSEQEVAAILAKTAAAAKAGRYELYKTSEHFDSTARNPQWLG